MEGTLARTNRLYNLLEQYEVPHTTVTLSTERNAFLYDLIVVEKGVALREEAPRTDTIFIEPIAVNPITDDRIVGTIRGTGFKLGDAVIVNSNDVFASFFGNDKILTFDVPIEVLDGQSSFTIEVFRASTLERSTSKKVVVPRLP